jgi:hypothetical protein
LIYWSSPLNLLASFCAPAECCEFKAEFNVDIGAVETLLNFPPREPPNESLDESLALPTELTRGLGEGLSGYESLSLS